MRNVILQVAYAISWNLIPIAYEVVTFVVQSFQVLHISTSILLSCFRMRIFYFSKKLEKVKSSCSEYTGVSSCSRYNGYHVTMAKATFKMCYQHFVESQYGSTSMLFLYRKKFRSSYTFILYCGQIQWQFNLQQRKSFLRNIADFAVFSMRP